jgi:SPP1 family predicted phage head-tail adaptor
MRGEWLTEVIEIQNENLTKDDVGQNISNWAAYKQTRAREIFKSGNERFEDGDRNFQIREFEIRYDPLVVENQRIVINNEPLTIKYLRPIKRRQGLIITCERVNGQD